MDDNRPVGDLGRFRLRLPCTAGPWHVRSSRDLLHNQFARVAVDHVTRPDGADGEHVVVAIKPGVCVLPLDAGGNLLLTREYHYAIARYSLEGVSGGRDAGRDGSTESPEACARRELREELGIEASRIDRLTVIDPFTSIMVSPTAVFVARDLVEGAAAPEGSEQIAMVRVPLGEALELVRRGEITHAPTCVGILWLALGLPPAA